MTQLVRAPLAERKPGWKTGVVGLAAAALVGCGLAGGTPAAGADTVSGIASPNRPAR